MQQEQSLYNKRRLVALGALVLLVLIVLLLIWWWFLPRAVPTETVTPEITPDDRVILPTQVQVLPAPAPTTPVTEGEMALLSLARNFAERYGSWSTDSRYQNLYDLMPRVTERLQSEFQKTIDQAPAPGEFRGSETTALNLAIQSNTGTRATVVVTVQQVETDGQLRTQESYRKLSVTMIKDGEFWLVDSAVWQ